MKYNYLKSFYLYLSLALICVGYVSCSDENPLEEYPVKQVKIYLTDDPIGAEAVNVEIKSIILKGKGSDEIELNTLSGVYNLLDYTGDLDTLIASGNYDLDEIKEIILVLGDENSIQIDGQLYPLSVPNDKKIVKLKVEVDLTENTLFDLLLDFDACESVKENNGIYTLNPVIRFKGNRNIKTLDKSAVIALSECYELQFPVMVLTTEEETKPVDDLETLLMLYSEETIYGVKYPITVVGVNGNTEIIRNGNQAVKLINLCNQPEEGKDLASLIQSVNKCFEIIFPLNVIDLNGMVIMLNDMEELENATNLQDFDYPVILYAPSGDSININNINQLEEKIKNCLDGGVSGIDVTGILDSLDKCYSLEFPIKVKFNDGTFQEIFSIAELASVSGQPLAIIFPIYIKEGNTDITKINNLSQVKKLLESCQEEESDFVKFQVIEVLSRLENCVEIMYPVTGILENGETYEIDSIVEILDLDINTVGVVFPFYVVDKSGNKQKISSLDDIEKIFKSCENNEEIAFEDLVAQVELCYDIAFPVQVRLLMDSTILTIMGIDELWKTMDEYDVYTFVYPVDIVDFDGKSQRINNSQQLKALSKKCDKTEVDLLKKLSSCYEIKFPVTVITKDREELVANTLEELEKYWKEYAELKFNYPIFLINKDGEEIEIKNRGKLNDALKNCE